MAELVRIGGGSLSAAINPLGAELTSLMGADGRELMTDADPAFWTGHAPILFPIVGRLNGDVLRVDGREYPMKQHGFARRSLFALDHADADVARFVLTDSAETRAQYPFAFRLTVEHAISWQTLTITASVENTGDRPLPASLGFHPAFAWPLPFGCPRDDHRIFFNSEEPEPICALTADGTVAAAPRPSPVEGHLLPLRDDLFAHDALIWARVRSDQLVYGCANGPQLMIGHADMPMLGIWTKPGARFICIEPWHGMADPEGYAGELADKPGIFLVPPGETKRIAMSITLLT